MGHTKEPGGAHHALMTDLRGICSRYEGNGMAGVERIAVLAQVIGKEIRHLPPGSSFTAADLLRAVALNIEAGNKPDAPVALAS